MPSGSDYNARLADYTQVKDRIRLFYEKYPDGRLVTAEVSVSSEPDGVPRVWVHAKAYRTPDDQLPGDGWSWMILPGSTPYTRGSELENTETSAWGRAIGALNIGIEGGLASVQEVQNKEGEAQREDDGGESVELLGRVKVAGNVDRGGSRYFQAEYRETPTGHAIGFKLKRVGKEKDLPQVLVGGGIGEALFHAHPNLVGLHVTLNGHLYTVRRPGRSSYQRLIVGEQEADWIETKDVRIPPADRSGEAQEALPFDAEESARIDAEESGA